MLHCECPSCKAKFEAAPHLAGKTIVCPGCGQSVNVPGAGATGITTPAVADAQQAKKRAATRGDHKQGAALAPPGERNWLAFGVVVMIGIVVAFFLAVLLMQSTGGGGGDGAGGTTVVVMETSMGPVRIELYQDKAPTSVANFLKYVDDKHYDGTIFHRVIENFMIQGGGFVPGLREKGSKYAPIRNEAGNGLRNERGTLAMARTGDPNSATDQFFINTVDNRFLDRANAQDGVGYAVFGRVIDGMDVVDRIRHVETRNAGGHEAVPVRDVTIVSIRRAE